MDQLKALVRTHQKIKIVNDCWQLPLNEGQKYATVSINGRAVGAHRFFYNYYVGSIPEGYFVCHHCDNPSCVNPLHLFVGNHQDNMDDMMSKGRHYKLLKSHCKNGHEYTIENTKERINLQGKKWRTCRECERRRWQRANKKARYRSK